jgi:hypothetical protein
MIERIYPPDRETVSRILVETAITCGMRLYDLFSVTKAGQCTEKIWRCAQECMHIVRRK